MSPSACRSRCCTAPVLLPVVSAPPPPHRPPVGSSWVCWWLSNVPTETQTSHDTPGRSFLRAYDSITSQQKSVKAEPQSSEVLKVKPSVKSSMRLVPFPAWLYSKNICVLAENETSASVPNPHPSPSLMKALHWTQKSRNDAFSLFGTLRRDSVFHTVVKNPTLEAIFAFISR